MLLQLKIKKKIVKNHPGGYIIGVQWHSIDNRASLNKQTTELINTIILKQPGGIYVIFWIKWKR